MAELSLPEAWPAGAEPVRDSLPQLADLPRTGDGYDAEAVEAAFDAFYRHAARLDATLRALEAVEAFRRDAADLRGDLLALRAYGFRAAGAEPRWERPLAEGAGVALRLGAECALIVGVATIAAVGNLRPVAIVGLMAAALAVVLGSEWLAARSGS